MAQLNVKVVVSLAVSMIFQSSFINVFAMKKRLNITILLIILSTLMLSAQDLHLRFMGISLNGSIDVFQKKLAAKNIYPDRESNKQLPFGQRSFTGYFAGKKCDINVSYDKKRNVYQAGITYESFNSESADIFYDNMKELLMEKYKNDSVQYSELYGFPVVGLTIRNGIGNKVGDITLSRQTIDYHQELGYDDGGPQFGYDVYINYYDAINWQKNEDYKKEDL